MRGLTTAALLAFAGGARGELRFEPALVDLGVVRTGATASATFRVRNVGATPVQVLDVERPCGCLAPEWSRKTFAAGEDGTLTLRLRTLGQATGPRGWNATVVSRVGERVVKTPFAVRATLEPELTLEPAQVALYVEKSAEQIVTLRDARATPLRVVGWRTDAPGLTIAKVDAGPGVTRLKLTARADALPAGRHEHVVRLETSDATYPAIELPVTLAREAPRLARFTPETPEVILAPGQAKASVLVRVRAETLDVLAVEPSEPGIDATWLPSESDGGHLKIVVDRARYRRESLQAAVRLRTRQGDVAVPLLVRVE